MAWPTSSPEDNGEYWERLESEAEPADTVGMLLSDFAHDPDALQANLIGVLGRAANLAPLSYRIGDTDQVLGQPAQALALQVFRVAQEPHMVADEAGRQGFEAVFGFLHETLGRRNTTENFRSYLETIIDLKARATEGLTTHERRRLVIFDVRLRHAAGRYFHGYCEEFGTHPPPATHVHPGLYAEYFWDAAYDGLAEPPKDEHNH